MPFPAPHFPTTPHPSDPAPCCPSVQPSLPRAGSAWFRGTRPPVGTGAPAPEMGARVSRGWHRAGRRLPNGSKQGPGLLAAPAGQSEAACSLRSAEASPAVAPTCVPRPLRALLPPPSTSLPADSVPRSPSADPCVYLVRGQPAVCPGGKIWSESYTFPGRAVPALDARSGEGNGSQRLLMPACPPFILQGPGKSQWPPLCASEGRRRRGAAGTASLGWSPEPWCSCPQHGMGGWAWEERHQPGAGNCSCP